MAAQDVILYAAEARIRWDEDSYSYPSDSSDSTSTSYPINPFLASKLDNRFIDCKEGNAGGEIDVQQNRG